MITTSVANANKSLLQCAQLLQEEAANLDRQSAELKKTAEMLTKLASADYEPSRRDPLDPPRFLRTPPSPSAGTAIAGTPALEQVMADAVAKGVA